MSPPDLAAAHLERAHAWLRRAAESTDIRHSQQRVGAEDLAAEFAAIEQQAREQEREAAGKRLLECACPDCGGTGHNEDGIGCHGCAGFGSLHPFLDLVQVSGGDARGVEPAP